MVRPSDRFEPCGTPGDPAKPMTASEYQGTRARDPSGAGSVRVGPRQIGYCGPPMRVYKGPTYVFRNDVLLAFHEVGFVRARTWIDDHGHATDERVRGDILGLPFTVATRNQKTLRFSEALREVERESSVAGTEVFVSVLARRGYPMGASYATTSLDVMLRLLASAYPEAVAKW